MNDTLPAQPIRSSISSTESTDFPGQIITYTCHPGFEFVGDPEAASVSAPETTTTTTTTTTMSTLEPWSTLTWTTFAGAEYAMGIETFDVTWNQARQRCQSENGDLASISSYQIQRAINQAYAKGDSVWIGGTDEALEGTYTWTDGLTWEYHNFGCSVPSDNTKNCVKMEGNSNRWKDEDCNAIGIKKYICMKGTSTSPFWFPILGAEYSLIRDNCVNTWDKSKAGCQLFGGEMASITSQEAKDAIRAHFENHSPTKIWIGLNDKANEGTYVWDKGETFQWSSWASNEPDNDGDCVRVSKDIQFKVEDCSNTDVKSVFCMRGDLSTAGRKRKKREVLLEERYRRQVSVDLITQREIKCESIWDGEGGYWSYTHEVPKYCFSKP